MNIIHEVHDVMKWLIINFKLHIFEYLDIYNAWCWNLINWENINGKRENLFEEISHLFHFIRIHFYKSFTWKGLTDFKYFKNFHQPTTAIKRYSSIRHRRVYKKNIYEKLICQKIWLETTSRHFFDFGVLPSPTNPS